MKKSLRFEPVFDKNIYLKEDTKILMERIQNRNREDENITEEFIEEL